MVERDRIEVLTLKNGLKLVVYQMPGAKSISFGIYVKMGGRYEDEKYKGISHFMEHMVFKGSRKFSCRQIKEELEGVGGNLNAFTSEENTCYFVKIPKKHILKAAEVISDMVFYPNLNKEDIEMERMVIFEEIRMYMDLPQSRVIELAQELLWANHPLGLPLAGTIETVSAITQDVMRGFHNRYYGLPNAVVSIAGDIEDVSLKKVVSILEEINKDSQLIKENKFSLRQRRPRAKYLPKDTEQTHLCLCMPAFSYTSPKRYAQEVLNVLLGGNMSSRLFNEVREKRGLAYYISSSLMKMKDTAGLFIKAGTEHRRAKETVEVVLQEISKISKGKVSKKEFERAKEFLLGQIILQMEDTLENMLYVGGKLLCLGKVESPSFAMESIKKVTMDDVVLVAEQIFSPNRYNFAAICPEGVGEKLMGVFG